MQLVVTEAGATPRGVASVCVGNLRSVLVALVHAQTGFLFDGFRRESSHVSSTEDGQTEAEKGGEDCSSTEDAFCDLARRGTGGDVGERARHHPEKRSYDVRRKLHRSQPIELVAQSEWHQRR